MFKAFMVIVGCIHLVVIGYILGCTEQEKETNSEIKKLREQVYNLTSALYRVNELHVKLYDYVHNKEEKHED